MARAADERKILRRDFEIPIAPIRLSARIEKTPASLLHPLNPFPSLSPSLSPSLPLPPGLAHRRQRPCHRRALRLQRRHAHLLARPRRRHRRAEGGGPDARGARREARRRCRRRRRFEKRRERRRRRRPSLVRRRHRQGRRRAVPRGRGRHGEGSRVRDRGAESRRRRRKSDWNGGGGDDTRGGCCRGSKLRSLRQASRQLLGRSLRSALFCSSSTGGRRR